MAQNVTLPQYTRGEEIFNWVGHCVGAALSVVALVVGIVFSALYNDTRCIISVVVYGITMILLYTMSTIYHALRPNKAKKVFRIIDHCAIFLLIAGTYTPYTLVTLGGTWYGWTVFGVVWAAAIIGIVLNAIDLHKYRKISMICYLAMGWCIIAAIIPLFKSLALGGIILLVLGGLCYTVGAVFYGCGKKRKYIHSTWHLFVLAGSIFQFFSILIYVILA